MVMFILFALLLCLPAVQSFVHPSRWPSHIAERIAVSGRAITEVSMNMIPADEDVVDRRSFMRAGVLGLGAASILGLSQPADAGLFNLKKNEIVLEDVSERIILGKSETVEWATCGPVITRLRKDVRERFASTGAKGGREIYSFYNMGNDGGDLLVGLEVTDPKTSPALGEGFAVQALSNPGLFAREDTPKDPGFLDWAVFFDTANKEYELRQPLSMFQVSSDKGSSQGGSMYVSVTGPLAK